MTAAPRRAHPHHTSDRCLHRFRTPCRETANAAKTAAALPRRWYHGPRRWRAGPLCASPVAPTHAACYSPIARPAHARADGPALTHVSRSAPSARPTHARANTRSAPSARPARARTDAVQRRCTPRAPLQACGRRPSALTRFAPNAPLAHTREVQYKC